MSALQTNTKFYTLNDGKKIPAVGLGTWRTSPEDDPKHVVETALKNGYRHIDTAAVYGNEKHVGDGIKASGIPREEIFVTTKLWNTDHKNVRKAVEDSLKNLKLDYIDLYLIHWPVEGDLEDKNAKIHDGFEPYLQMQELQKEGKVKSIGVSNFTQKKIESLLSHPEITVKPAVNQIEAHPLLPQWSLYEYLKKENILIEAYSPLGSQGSPLFKNETVLKIAKDNNVEPGHVMVSWAVQRGTVVLPKSVHDKWIATNNKTFTLRDEDFAALNNLADLQSPQRTNDPMPALWED